MISILEIIATVIAILGNIFIIYKNRMGFMIWIISNVLWIIFATLNQHYFMSILFFFYLILSIIGFIKWK